MKVSLAPAVVAATLLIASAAPAQTAADDELRSLEGTWIMDSAYEIKADGSRVTFYGERPLGLLIVDSSGRYSLQIYRAGRPTFASGDKTRGTQDEYQLAVLGSSTHFGKVAIDKEKHQLIFEVRAASFPNWEGKRQIRDYIYRDGLLSYAVPASASSSGIIAHSIWRRAAP